MFSVNSISWVSVIASQLLILYFAFRGRVPWLVHLVCLVVLTSLFLVKTPVAAAELIDLTYDRWEIKYNCEKRGYESFHYVTLPDTGSLERFKPFHQEERLPKRCRQFSTSPYKAPSHSKIKYHRGHGIHQNLWDHSKDLMEQSNSMANVVPQAAILNTRGVWRQTEILTECWRDKGRVEVWGGVIWGEGGGNDHFLQSHGVVTPDALWKVIRFPSGEVNAWMMPNDDSATAVKMDTFLVSPATIAKYTGLSFEIERNQYSEKDSHSVSKPKNCSLR